MQAAAMAHYWMDSSYFTAITCALSSARVPSTRMDIPHQMEFLRNMRSLRWIMLSPFPLDLSTGPSYYESLL